MPQYLVKAPGDPYNEPIFIIEGTSLAGQPNADPTSEVLVEEADPGLLEGGLNTHQRRNIAHDRARFSLDPADGRNIDLGRFCKVALDSNPAEP